jgi:hypothetical protein
MPYNFRIMLKMACDYRLGPNPSSTMEEMTGVCQQDAQIKQANISIRSIIALNNCISVGTTN